MQARIIARVTIGADKASIFKYLEHLKYHFLWNPPLQEITPMTTLKLGTRYKSTSLILGVRVQGTNVVSKFIPNQEVELQNDTGPVKYKVNYQLKTDKKKTVLTCRTIVSSDSHAFAFTKPLLKLLAQRELQSDLKALKIAVEQKLG